MEEKMLGHSFIRGFDPRYKIETRRTIAREVVSQSSDEELIQMFREWEQEYRGKLPKDRINHILYVSNAPESFYKGIAAVDVLRQRYGKDYVEELTGVPQKTLVEKVWNCARVKLGF